MSEKLSGRVLRGTDAVKPTWLHVFLYITRSSTSLSFHQTLVNLRNRTYMVDERCFADTVTMDCPSLPTNTTCRL